MNDTFDFDRFIDRRTLPGEKWGRYQGRNVLPLWVADMDFAAPPAILEALQARVAHGVFGYTAPWPSLTQAVIEAIAREHGWHVEADWLVWLPGVVTGLNLACRITGGSVFSATPIYPPFLAAPGLNERRLLTQALEPHGGRWQWNREAVEKRLAPDTALFLLCNPHNPTGRVFSRDELDWIAELGLRHDMILCSDEVHCGLTLEPGRPHLPIASLAPEIARRTITLMAPSKTWNIPSLYSAFAIIPDPALRRRFRHAMRGIVPPPNVLGLVAMEAAYRHGDPWRQALLAYLRGNRERVIDAVSRMPGLLTSAPEATYLAWIDCRGAALDGPAAFFERAGVGLSDGAAFGMPGFVRLNFGCPRATLDEALSRMRHALNEHRPA